MRKVAAVLLTLCPLCFAAGGQGAAPEGCASREMKSRVVEVQHKPLSLAAQLVDQLVGPCGAYRVSKALGALIVEDEPRRLPQIVEAVAEWDQPPRAVRVSVTLLMASRDLPAPEGVADELRDISQTLSEMTRWTRFKALGTGSVQVREGGEAVIDIADRYRVQLRIKGVDEERRSVLIEPFELDRLPVPISAGGASIDRPPRKLLGGELDLSEGRQHLVGATARGRQRAIFLVFTVWTGDRVEREVVLEQGN